jgi:glutaminyl-peptide cyclotransferase
MLVAVLFSTCAKKPEPARAKVVKSYPHDAGAFTQGLVWHEGHLYESTGLEGDSSICKVNLETGEVVRRKGLNKKYFGEGLALIGSRLHQLTYRNKVLFVYDMETFETLSEHPITSEGWGLTTDGTSLIWSDGTPKLRWLDPKSFQVTRELEVERGGDPLAGLNELEWIEGRIWANVFMTDTIVVIDPSSGSVEQEIDCSGVLDKRKLKDPRQDVLNGIAYDAATKRIFVTGKRWPQLFEIEVEKAQ